jgi:DNA-binding Lrp family transcriptional regulator
VPKNPSPRSPGPAPRPRPVLDEVDRTLVGLLVRDGRATNVELARGAGISESACL